MSDTVKLLENMQSNLNEDDNKRTFIHGENEAKSVDDLLQNYDNYEYDCYYCNKHEVKSIKDLISKFKNDGTSDDEIVEFFNSQYPPICNDCMEDEYGEENKSDLQSDIEDINSTFTDLEDRLSTPEAKEVMQNIWEILADKLNELGDSIDTSDIVG